MNMERTNTGAKPATRRAAPTRPPGAVSEARLQDLCTGCGDCAAVCPKHIIGLDDARLPVVTGMRACGHCGLCADICMHGAIELTEQTRCGLDTVLLREEQEAGMALTGTAASAGQRA